MPLNWCISEDSTNRRGNRHAGNVQAMHRIFPYLRFVHEVELVLYP